MKTISLTIDNNGNVKVNDVFGMGMSCQQATADIEKLLGSIDENSRSITASYFQEVDPLLLHNENQN